MPHVYPKSPVPLGTPTSTRKRTITSHALAQRIRRSLKTLNDDMMIMLRKSRGQRCRQELGEWYLYSANHNQILCCNVDIEKLGIGFEVLSPNEQVID